MAPSDWSLSPLPPPEDAAATADFLLDAGRHHDARTSASSPPGVLGHSYPAAECPVSIPDLACATATHSIDVDFGHVLLGGETRWSLPTHPAAAAGHNHKTSRTP
jgi:hypothetical protein